ncbi:hypothetical protein Mal64_39050 [Pseudobythopirellula maris]|uniref:Uncharacterized protein n=1 Tax=Pseudobythopirellula maris TaxID=2527991 RepID=A0A5C5ZGC5_9BACT|nr:hypothetical protein [Pseudobythopirellula maris]TWT86165.1 hypothetical protein Mal64_39050 [Pseudobythopirellula maris]
MPERFKTVARSILGRPFALTLTLAAVAAVVAIVLLVRPPAIGFVTSVLVLSALGWHLTQDLSDKAGAKDAPSQGRPPADDA